MLIPKDSNLDKRVWKPRCYRYTKNQKALAFPEEAKEQKLPVHLKQKWARPGISGFP